MNIFAKPLTDKEKIVLELRVKGLSLKAISETFNKTKEQIRQIEAKAIRKTQYQGIKI